MGDDWDDDEVESDELGRVYRDMGAMPLHWTDAPIAVLGFVAGVFSLLGVHTDRLVGMFKLHANYVADRKAVAREMAEDLERIVGGES